MNSDILRKALLRHAGAVAVILGAVAAIISLYAWRQGEDWRLEYSNLAIVNGIYWILLLYLFWIILSRNAPDFLGVPIVKAIHDKKILIVDGAPWLSLGVMAAIYVKDGEYERLVCTGEVVNVQTNKLVQIHIRDYEDIYNDIEAAGEKLNLTSKEAILIRPGLFRRVGE